MKFILRILPLFVVVLLLSASCVCPVVADGVVSSPSTCEYSVSLPSFDEKDTVYTFRTASGESGFVWERLNDAGVSEIRGIVVGDDSVILTQNTPDFAVAETSGGYLVSYDKRAGIVSLSCSDDFSPREIYGDVVATDASVLSSSLSSVVDSVRAVVNSWHVPCVLGGVLMVLGVSPVTLCMCLMSPVDAQTAQVYEFLPMFASAAEVGTASVYVMSATAVASATGVGLLAASGVLLAYFVGVKVIERQSTGEAYRFVTGKDGYIYKYEIDPKTLEKKNIMTVGEISIDCKGDINYHGGEIIKYNGKDLKNINDLPTVHRKALKRLAGVDYVDDTYNGKWDVYGGGNAYRYGQTTTMHLESTAKSGYYIVDDVKNINKKRVINTYDDAVEVLSDCRGKKSEEIFILGASENDCIKLCDDASKEIEGSGHKLDEIGRAHV